jgi:tRNA/tmRNA/rRNA uracil-C5-methylase (TrmA/RlmC/RlmD family)
MAWVKPFASFKKVRIAYCYEPVIFYGIDEKYREDEHIIRDFISAPMTTKTGVHGAKPKKFCNWLLAVLDVGPADEFFDLYPGSGAVTQAWNERKTQRKITGVE